MSGLIVIGYDTEAEADVAHAELFGTAKECWWTWPTLSWQSPIRTARSS